MSAELQGGITYPGLRIVQLSEDYYHIFLWQPDSRDRHLHPREQRGWDQWVELKLPGKVSKDYFAERIQDLVRRMLLHELDENFRVDEIPRGDPHPEGLSIFSQNVEGRRVGLYLEVLEQEWSLRE